MTRIVEGDLEGLLGPTVLEAGLTRVLLVTDRGVRAAGHCDTALESLKRAGVTAVVFDEVSPNPDESDIQRCADAAIGARVDGFVAVGGGSSIDTAKGANFIVTNGGAMRDYKGFATMRSPLLPMIVAPTTAGTGSEAQSYALIAHQETHAKMACGAPSALPRTAILDPKLTTTLSREQTAITGLDAIVHAVETYVCTARTTESDALAFEAYRLLGGHFGAVLEHPTDLDSRGAMLRGACLAGQAIELSMLGAAHAAANPLTAEFGVPHGVAVARMLPSVIQNNASAPHVATRYHELAAALGGGDLVEQIRGFIQQSGIPALRQFGIEQVHASRLSQDAANQWTARFNPVEFDSDVFEAVYCEALLE